MCYVLLSPSRRHRRRRAHVRAVAPSPAVRRLPAHACTRRPRRPGPRRRDGASAARPRPSSSVLLPKERRGGLQASLGLLPFPSTRLPRVGLAQKYRLLVKRRNCSLDACCLPTSVAKTPPASFCFLCKPFLFFPFHELDFSRPKPDPGCARGSQATHARPSTYCAVRVSS